MKWTSDELERKRPRCRPGNFHLVLYALYHLLFLRPSVTVGSLESLPFLRLLVPAPTQLRRHRRSCRTLRLHEPPRSHAAPLHHARTIRSHGNSSAPVIAFPIQSNNKTSCHMIWAGLRYLHFFLIP